MPLRPELVVEVRYEHMEGDRFRHTAQFNRWRPDRDPRSCTYEQLEEPVQLRPGRHPGPLITVESSWYCRPRPGVGVTVVRPRQPSRRQLQVHHRLP